MNILIVGNGFDLSHYLPTKYDHFMVAMGAIENWDKSKGDMGFDDIFGRDYWFKNDKTGEEWQNIFFQYTKAMYKTDEIKISIEKINELQKQLKENVWYQYFSDHVREVKTWIDFERKIQQALETVFSFFNLVKAHSNQSNELNRKVESYSYKAITPAIVLGGYESSLLYLLGILECEYKVHHQDEAGDFQYIKVNKNEKWDSCSFSINEKYVFQTRNFEEFKFDEVVRHLQKNLDEFISIFNSYLEIIEKLKSKKMFNLISEIKSSIKVFSFNYTTTCEKNYGMNQIEFLHGKLGKEQNIVLGISDLERKYLEKYKFYGFTKYHQKLFKNTDYNFLHDIKEKLFSLYSRKEKFINAYNSAEHMKIRSLAETQKLFKNIEEINKSLANLSGKIIVWGHSLDRSDINYIKEIFELNQHEKNFEIIIYYYNSQTKFELLANLLDILEQKKVETWMKKGWLKFEPNPNIAELNNIQPVKLPKIAEA